MSCLRRAIWGKPSFRNSLAVPYRPYSAATSLGKPWIWLFPRAFRVHSSWGIIGKLVKLAGNMFQTHSRYGDCRMDILIACAAVAGGISSTLAAEVAQSATTDHAMEILSRAGLWEKTLSVLLARIQENLVHRTAKQAADFLTGAVLFSRARLYWTNPSSLPLWEYWKEKSV